MKVVQINATCSSGSTGRICVAVSRALNEAGLENYILYNNGVSDYEQSYRYSTSNEIKAAALSSRLAGNWGFENKKSTRRLIEKLEELNPDIIQLHNIHSHACHLGMLFDWIRDRAIKVFWTFHDCWAFTGYCMYYDALDCERWKSGCSECPQKKAYSWFFDKSHTLYKRKQALFHDLDMTIITPSNWLADQVKMSFLKDYPVEVIHNGIDLKTFRPISSDFRKIHNIGSRYMLLGVALVWEVRKGIDVFCRLAKELDEHYQIVLVGVDDAIKKDLPKNIIAVSRTKNARELAAVYTAADVFVNPTREDNFPTVNIEALACGTPVITFETGGSPECIDKTCGVVVKKDDIDSMREEIKRICTSKPYSEKVCTDRAELFNEKDKYLDYVRLYQNCF